MLKLVPAPKAIAHERVQLGVDSALDELLWGRQFLEGAEKLELLPTINEIILKVQELKSKLDKNSE